jgi:hypothetical protein
VPGCNTSCPFPDEAARPSLAGWTTIEVFDTAAARIALARRKLGCPGCGQPLRSWGHARERTVRDLGGALVRVRPDRALCTRLRITGIRTVVAFDQDALPARVRPDELGCALEHLRAAAVVIGGRCGLEHTSRSYRSRRSWASKKPNTPPEPLVPRRSAPVFMAASAARRR